MDKKAVQNRVKDLETIAIISIMCLLLFCVFHNIVFIILSISLLIIALIFKKMASFIVMGWLKVSDFIASFNTMLILSFVFYAFLTPIACCYRLFSKDNLCLKRLPLQISYFYDRNHLYIKEDLEKMW
jgi:hypothetical protein